MDGAELYALARKHQEMHRKAVDIVSKLYTRHRIFQREAILDIGPVHWSLEQRIKDHRDSGFGWHTVMEGWAGWIPDLFLLIPYATVLESLASFAEEHQLQAKKQCILSDDVQEALLRAWEVRDGINAVCTRVQPMEVALRCHGERVVCASDEDCFRVGKLLPTS